MLNEIKRDFTALEDGSTFERLNNRGLHALTAYRLSNLLWRRRVPIVPQLLTRLVQIVYGIDISWRSVIGPGVKIFHGSGLVVGPGAVIGEGSVLYNGVTIGAIDFHKTSRLPTLGKRVIVYCGAKVLGDIHVGDDAIVGANAVVLRDVSPNCVAVGVPARELVRSNEVVPR